MRRNVDDALACRKKRQQIRHQTLAVRGAEDNIGFLQSPCVLRERLCHAARQHHNGIRVIFFRAAKNLPHLTVTFGRDRAGVEDYDVRRFLVLRCGKAVLQKGREHRFRFILVHLAAEGDDLCFHHIFQFPFVTRRFLPAKASAPSSRSSGCPQAPFAQ